jgi:hypothetical protein
MDLRIRESRTGNAVPDLRLEPLPILHDPTIPNAYYILPPDSETKLVVGIQEDFDFVSNREYDAIMFLKAAVCEEFEKAGNASTVSDKIPWMRIETNSVSFEIP